MKDKRKLNLKQFNRSGQPGPSDRSGQPDRYEQPGQPGREKERIYHRFGPVFDSNSRILILGSFPSVKSREQNFYYGHPRNRFWKVMAAVCEDTVPETAAEKKDFLLRNHIALWDVIESCTITGSSDDSIRDVRVNDLRPLLDRTKITDGIFTNGGKAAEIYRKQFFPEIGIASVKLPSTSPANAVWSLERLVSEWSRKIKSILF